MNDKLGRVVCAAAGLAVMIVAGCETQASLTKKRTRLVEKGLLREVTIKGLKTKEARPRFPPPVL